MHIYKDRKSAGLKLAEAFLENSRINTTDGLVALGLLKGGVIVADAFASALNIPLDVLPVKKLGAPLQSELAIGAVCAEDTVILNQPIIKSLGLVEEDVLNRIESAKIANLNMMREIRKYVPEIDLRGMRAAIIDDGIATGASAKAAVAYSFGKGVKDLYVLSPVSPESWDVELSSMGASCICPNIVKHFIAVGYYYEEFHQVELSEVMDALKANRAKIKNVK